MTPKRWRKITLLMTAAGALILIGGFLLGGVWSTIGTIVCIAAIVVAKIIDMLTWCCPFCGHALPRESYLKFGVKYCPHCRHDIDKRP